MLSKSDIDLEQAIGMLSKFQVAAALFVPTRTALEKSIIDAHSSFRAFLEREGIHDFARQRQGPAGKVEIPVQVITSKAIERSTITLYRPETKNGDPRFWISRLNRYSNPNNLWALWVDSQREIYATNVTQALGVDGALEPESPIRAVLERNLEKSKNPVADELLEKLVEIRAKGFVSSLRAGDTGVGFTLETLLGISANSKKAPDYKGIELKSKRFVSGTRVNLFSQVPDWHKSPTKNAEDLVKNFGYFDQVKSRQALYVTVSNKPNAQGLYFEVDEDLETLKTNKYEGQKKTGVVQWDLGALKLALKQKHAESFWVTAQRRFLPNGEEQFLYTAVTHTKSPLDDYFAPLVETGVITMDFTLHLKHNGKARDHGYLFKIKPSSLDLLFPSPDQYDLTKFLSGRG